MGTTDNTSSTTTHRREPKPFVFEDLPAELRVIIYDYCLPHHNQPLLWKSRKDPEWEMWCAEQFEPLYRPVNGYLTKLKRQYQGVPARLRLPILMPLLQTTLRDDARAFYLRNSLAIDLKTIDETIDWLERLVEDGCTTASQLHVIGHSTFVFDHDDSRKKKTVATYKASTLLIRIVNDGKDLEVLSKWPLCKD